MSELVPPDSHYLNFAHGWLELRNFAEAWRDLERIDRASAEHPDVLEARWRLLAEEHRWPEALDTARRLISVAPENPTSWIDQSFALHELKNTHEARSQLLLVARKFPAISTIPYNLACYACQLGDFQESLDWLAKATRIAGKDEIKRMALSDPDLQPLWQKIQKL
jgi:tetratricopeptide (TPR) repeat protein